MSLFEGLWDYGYASNFRHPDDNLTDVLYEPLRNCPAALGLDVRCASLMIWWIVIVGHRMFSVVYRSTQPYPIEVLRIC